MGAAAREVGHREQGAGFGVALTQRCVADFVALVLRRGGLELAYAALDVLIVSHDLGDSQRPGFVDCWGGFQHRSFGVR